jgi:hypothetical protein
MRSKKYVLSQFEAIRNMNYGAKFYKADLHFHTPGSEDARGRNRYDFNPYSLKQPKSEKELVSFRESILKDARKVASDIVNRFIAVDLSIVAVTDHNGIATIYNDTEAEKKMMDLAAPTWYELIDDEAQKENQKAGKTILTILPGVEISTSGAHILAIFPPMRPRRKVHFIICDLLNETGFDIEEFGKNPEVGTASMYDTIDLVVKKGGIPIPAHIDGSDQAMLKLHKVKSGAMKNLFLHDNLFAVEIVDSAKFIKKKNRTGKSLHRWITDLRTGKDLPPFAYFQGSDAHDLPTIAKRHTFLKMTEPSFSGLSTAIEMPSSRVRISASHTLPSEGYFLFGLRIENAILGKRTVRFNRHMNCIVGKIGSGKRPIFEAMQAAVLPEYPAKSGKAVLFTERVINGVPHYYVFLGSQSTSGLYEINPDKQSLENVAHLRDELTPKFYKPEKINDLISSPEKLNTFLVNHFGRPNQKNIARFNEQFAIANFLEEEKEALFKVEKGENGFALSFNVKWHAKAGKPNLVNFFKLREGLRKTAIMCMLIIANDFGPAIISAPEDDLDNDDITDFLVPVIKKNKDFQQVIIFSTNPTLAVNTDPDNYVLMERKNGKINNIRSGFAIDSRENLPQLMEILEGGAKAFRKRVIRYEA